MVVVVVEPLWWIQMVLQLLSLEVAEVQVARMALTEAIMRPETKVLGLPVEKMGKAAMDTNIGVAVVAFMETVHMEVNLL